MKTVTNLILILALAGCHSRTNKNEAKFSPYLDSVFGTYSLDDGESPTWLTFHEDSTYECDGLGPVSKGKFLFRNDTITLLTLSKDQVTRERLTVSLDTIFGIQKGKLLLLKNHRIYFSKENAAYDTSIYWLKKGEPRDTFNGTGLSSKSWYSDSGRISVQGYFENYRLVTGVKIYLDHDRELRKLEVSKRGCPTKTIMGNNPGTFYERTFEVSVDSMVHLLTNKYTEFELYTDILLKSSSDVNRICEPLNPNDSNLITRLVLDPGKTMNAYKITIIKARYLEKVAADKAFELLKNQAYDRAGTGKDVGPGLTYTNDYVIKTGSSILWLNAPCTYSWTDFRKLKRFFRRELALISPVTDSITCQCGASARQSPQL
jgi:hypothetical protein